MQNDFCARLSFVLTPPAGWNALPGVFKYNQNGLVEAEIGGVENATPTNTGGVWTTGEATFPEQLWEFDSSAPGGAFTEDGRRIGVNNALGAYLQTRRLLIVETAVVMGAYFLDPGAYRLLDFYVWQGTIGTWNRKHLNLTQEFTSYTGVSPVNEGATPPTMSRFYSRQPWWFDFGTTWALELMNNQIKPGSYPTPVLVLTIGAEDSYAATENSIYETECKKMPSNPANTIGGLVDQYGNPYDLSAKHSSNEKKSTTI